MNGQEMNQLGNGQRKVQLRDEEIEELEYQDLNWKKAKPTKMDDPAELNREEMGSFPIGDPQEI